MIQMQVCFALRLERKTVPEVYEQAVQRALWIFQHQRVWCPQLKQLVQLHPLPQGALAAGTFNPTPPHPPPPHPPPKSLLSHHNAALEAFKQPECTEQPKLCEIRTTVDDCMAPYVSCCLTERQGMELSWISLCSAKFTEYSD